MATRWEYWRHDTEEQRIRNIARDLDENDARLDRHDRYHKTREDDELRWREHVDEEIEGLKKILLGFIVSAAGIVIVAAINVVVLIAQG